MRHENMQELSYQSASQDLVLHFDVLEHVPSPKLATDECLRVLRPGGLLLFSCPFYPELDATIVRAHVDDGELIYDLEPVYHGNPVDGKGALVFNQFGWDLFDMLEGNQDIEVEMWLSYNATEGVLDNGCPFPNGKAWPLTFVVRKKH